MSQNESFDWVPFYSELAGKLVPYRTRQKELIEFLEQLRAQGLTVTPLEDQDQSGRRFLLSEIDPFTFFGSFNRGIAVDVRVRILDSMKSRFSVTAAIPTAFSGVPTLNNLMSRFFSYQPDRKPGDVDRLWEVFTRALGDEPLKDPEFGEAFNRAIEVRCTNVNLTMGLFWIRPNRFISLDGKMRDYLGIELPKDGLSFDFYRETLKQVLDTRKEDLPHLSLLAHLAREAEHPKASRRDSLAEINEDIDYWLVGAYWSDADPQDQTDRFLAEGIWKNGWKDRLLDQVNAMKVGDRIAIKATFTQKHDLPFDNRGNTVSAITIRATGTVVKNLGDGRTVEVSWDTASPPRTWYFYTYQPTIWHLKENQFAQRLIRFAFYGEPQDYGYFIKRWWDEPQPVSDSASEMADGETEAVTAEAVAPYGPADMIDEGVFLSEEEIELALRRLRLKKNLILQGAPGVGKTFIAKRLAYALMGTADERRVAAVQFHPSYSYEDFVRGYRPTSQAAQFVLSDGPLIRVCDAAEKDDRPYVLLVDEINRANLSQVFGELFMLLEGDKRGKQHAVLPLYPRSQEEKLFVPENVYLIGTMNIADRSLALVDFALRRRFAFFDLEPRFSDPVFRNWLKGRGMADSLCLRVITRMSALNTRIEKGSRLGPAYRVGHSFFCPTGTDLSGLDERWYIEIVKTEILPLLNEYWFDAPDEVEAVRSELLA